MICGQAYFCWLLEHDAAAGAQRSHEMEAERLKTVGILGAGRVGAAVARQALAAGYRVRMATAKAPHELALALQLVAPEAEAVTPREAVATDLVVLAIPLHRYATLSPELFDGKIVIDAMNYWHPTDGAVLDLDSDHRSSSEIVQDHLYGAHVVKTLNHIAFRDVEAHARRAGSPGRRALALAGDHDEAKRIAGTFIHHLGYDPVDAGPLSAGRVLEPGTEIFNGVHTAGELRKLIECARIVAHA
ncbi:NADPH-dependent F420 reductase [Neomicrococcus aestuarii]